MATASQSISSPAVNTSPFYGIQLRRFAIRAIITLFVFLFLMLYLMPMANMFFVALSDQEMLSHTADSVIFPMRQDTFDYKGQKLLLFDLAVDGKTKPMAILKKGRESSTFIDPANPDAAPIEWTGSWRTLQAIQTFSPQWSNFPTAWEKADFPVLFRNTLIIAVTGMIGTILSCICVAYAFARFPLPGKNILFLILIGTIILPSQVTLIPTYAFFSAIGWVGTQLPLIVPHFFANAYNVFLLRQYFLTLPRELDEAAMIDGAGPFKVLVNVIIPQSWPVIISVAVFHFIFAWNDFFGPLIYLLGHKELYPISVGVQAFNFQYGPHPEWVQATSLMAMVLPLLIFFLAQRVFMRGVVITGVEK